MNVYAVYRSPPSRNQVTTVPKRRPLVQLIQVAAPPTGGQKTEDGDAGEERREHRQCEPIDHASRSPSDDAVAR
jgi:hypothetical protein